MVQLSKRWWKDGVCYQVWPASFKDSNGDGFGDLQGIISKLDYLKDLGVDFIWLSPCYDSPRHDMGYDIRNYEDIDPDFGTLQDMGQLIEGLHDRDMRLVLDLVVNHTSSEHAWFQESMKSRDNEYSDFYIWRDPKIVDGKKVEPNNWASIFGGSAWKYVEARDQYYLHLFLETQPDTNWEHQPLRQALYKSAIRFWLDRGVDGFRVDAVNLYSKPLDFPDAIITDPGSRYQGPPFDIITNGPRMHEFLQEQRKQAIEPYGDVALIGELGHSSTEQLLKYLDPKYRELDMVFDMEVVAPDGFPSSDKSAGKHDFSLPVVRHGFTRPQKIISELDRWSTVFLENHDNPRSVSKYGSPSPSLRIDSGKCLALLLCTLSGTLFVYQGQEIGINNLPEDWPIADMRDEWWIGKFKEIERRYPGDEEKIAEARVEFQFSGRDHSRTPMQWSGEEPAAGFSTIKPWMQPNPIYKQGVTVHEEQSRIQGLWHFWKHAIALRKARVDIYVHGTTDFLDTKNAKVMYFTKRLPTEDKPRVVVALNFTDDEQDLKWPPEIDSSTLGSLLLGTKGEDCSAQQLAPREGRVYELM